MAAEVSERLGRIITQVFFQNQEGERRGICRKGLVFNGLVIADND